MHSKPRKVGVLIGSLRRGSFSRKVAKALIARAPAALDCRIIEIGDLPLYNEDLDSSPPRAWVSFRAALETCDALLFVTPEYNRSMPGCLKNATDIGSRPEGENLFDGLPAAVVSVSPYSLGGFGANHALRQNFVYLNLAVMAQPEAYVGNASELMNGRGTITNNKTDKFLTTFMQAFERWTQTAQTSEESFDAFLRRREKIVGAVKVNAANRKAAKAFGAGSAGRFEVLQSGSSGGFAFWTGIQHANMAMKGKKERVKMALRITEVFRAERGEWKLVHRHANKAERP